MILIEAYQSNHSTLLTELGKASVYFSISYTRSWTLLQAIRTLPDCRQCISKSLLLASKAVAAIPQFPWLILAWLLLPNSTDLTELLEALARRLRFDADRFPRPSDPQWPEARHRNLASDPSFSCPISPQSQSVEPLGHLLPPQVAFFFTGGIRTLKRLDQGSANR